MLQAVAKSNDVMVPIEESGLQSSFSALSEFCNEMGVVEITPGAVKKLRAAGVAMETLGTTNLTQPTTLATQQVLMRMLNKVDKLFDKPGLAAEVQTKLAHAAGYLGEKITRAGQAINDTAIENTGPRTAPVKMRRSSFAPGEVVDVQASPVQLTPPQTK